MRALVLVPYPLGVAPGQRYRFEQWAPYLREQGIETVFSSFATRELNRILYEPGRHVEKAVRLVDCLARRMIDAWRAADYDVVVIQREASLIGPAWSERLAHLRKPALVYDFDDAVYLPYVSPSNRYLSYLKFPWKTAGLCRMAKAVVAGNADLATWARQHNPAVDVVPSTVSLRTYRPRPRGEGRHLPVVGWMGSHSSALYLRLVEEPLRRLRQRMAFRILLVGAGPVSWDGLEVECRPWTAESELRDLWDMDIGIMPLPDEPWARAKCGMKAIQYMGAGIPAVVSPVGVNREIVTPGLNGEHAATPEDWVDALESLLRDVPRRERMGAAAYETVARAYSAEVQAPRVGAILKAAAA
jgi:glycosyltransferase involved in cell wall biosynthesis